MMTKKLLVAFDPRSPDKPSSDFLVVALEHSRATLVGVKSKTSSMVGLVVYIGKEITANDLFAKLVDTGQRIENVEQSLRMLEGYIQKLQEFRIGDRLTIEAGPADSFVLKKVIESPPS